MAQHIALMNLAAPLLALAILRVLPRWSVGALGSATALQLLLLWGWHSPPVLPFATHTAPLHLFMQASLFLSALWFWAAAITIADMHKWRALFALLTTSKLFCLLGVLLVFAPRVLYPRYLGVLDASALVADQQLAGLLMLVACPATYLTAGVVIATKWLRILERDESSSVGAAKHAG